jgi:hypothetical protein
MEDGSGKGVILFLLDKHLDKLNRIILLHLLPASAGGLGIRYSTFCGSKSTESKAKNAEFCWLTFQKEVLINK